jgi:hypothetical protein
MLTVIFSMNNWIIQKLILFTSLAAWQLINSLAAQKLTRLNPLFMRVYAAWQLVSLNSKTGKLRATIHALGSLSVPLSIYTYTDKVVSVYMFYINFYGINEVIS